MPPGRVATAGEEVAIDYEGARMQRLLELAIGQPLAAPADPVPTNAAATDAVPADAVPPSVQVSVQASRDPFDVRRLRPVTRDACSDGAVTVLHNACGSGFDLQIRIDDERSCLEVTARYRAAPALRAANAVLSRRFVLLAGQTLIHYPVLWRAGWRHRVPLHIAALASSAGTPLIAGPGGVGKSTVIMHAGADGVSPTADNLCVGDGIACFGLVEPLRIAASGRPGTSHGRADTVLNTRTPVLVPDRVVALYRGTRTRIESIKPDQAARYLVGGTYAAGELRRYWQFAATLALATGRGPAHPPVTETSVAYCDSLPCFRVEVGDGDRVSLPELCGVDQ
jgi:hypothetical protein